MLSWVALSHMNDMRVGTAGGACVKRVEMDSLGGAVYSRFLSEYNNKAPLPHPSHRCVLDSFWLLL